MKVPSWLWQPNVQPIQSVYMGIITVEIGLFLFSWMFGVSSLIPKPSEVIASFPELLKQGMVYHITISFLLNAQALALATVISLGLAYFSRFAIGYPIATAVSKMRFLGMIGLTYLFTVMVGGGHTLKLALLTFGMTVFFSTGMIAEVHSIPLVKFDHARTLRMGEWHTLWEVVILGTVDRAFEMLRQNAAMGWMMLSMVEGIVRSEGGIGTLLLNQDKHFNITVVFAIQLVILLVGLLQDAGIAFLKRMVCPHTIFTTGGK